MDILNKAMNNLREAKKRESEKLAKLVEKKKLNEGKILTQEQINKIYQEIDSMIESLQDEEESGFNLTREEAIKKVKEIFKDSHTLEDDSNLYEVIPEDADEEIIDEVLRIGNEYINSLQTDDNEEVTIEDVYKILNPENDSSKKIQIDLAMKSLNLTPEDYLDLMKRKGKI